MIPLVCFGFGEISLHYVADFDFGSSRKEGIWEAKARTLYWAISQWRIGSKGIRKVPWLLLYFRGKS